MKKITYILCILILLGCKENQRKVVSENSPQDGPCISIEERQRAITSILATDKFQMFLHPEIKGRLPIHLIENEFVGNELKIYSNEKRVVIQDSLFAKENTVRLKITSLDCTSKNIKFSIFYPIEGLVMRGNATKNNSKDWVVEITHTGEF